MANKKPEPLPKRIQIKWKRASIRGLKSELASSGDTSRKTIIQSEIAKAEKEIIRLERLPQEEQLNKGTLLC